MMMMMIIIIIIIITTTTTTTTRIIIIGQIVRCHKMAKVTTKSTACTLRCSYVI